MTDFASLALEIDSRQVATGVDQLDKLTEAGGRAEKQSGQLAIATNKVGSSAGQQRAAMQQLSYQIGDVSQQFALGVNPMTIFVQQSGQVVQALGLMTSSSKGFIGFMAGPWGTALLGAATILGALWAAHSKAADGAEEHQKAEDALAKSMEVLRDKVIQATQSIRDKAIADMQGAFAARTLAEANLKTAESELAVRRARNENYQSGAMGAGGGTGLDAGAGLMLGNSRAAASESTAIEATQKRINELRGTINDTTVSIRGLQGQLAQGEIERSFDASASASTQYSNRMSELNASLQSGKISLAEFSAEAFRAKVGLEAEKDAIEASNKSHRTRKTAMSESQRAYEQAVKATDRYIESLELEIEKIGKTPAQIRAIEIARAMEAAATDSQRQAIEKLNVAREHALGIEKLAKEYQAGLDWDRTVLAPLEREVQLVGLAGAAREAATLSLEKEAFMADLAGKGITDLADRWDRYYQARMGKAQAEEGIKREQEAADKYRESLQELQSIGENIDFSSAFGRGGEAINGMVLAMQDLTAAQIEYNTARDNASSPQEMAAAEKAYGDAKTASTLNVLGASKKLFDQQSAGYKVITALEKAFMAIKLVNTVKALVLDTTYTGTSVANSMVRGAADQAAGGAKMFSFLGPFAFPVVAAMVALLAGLGLKGGKGAAAPTMPTAEELQDQAGTGTVLGDSSAKSNSIANSLEIVASNTNRDLEYSNSMLIALRSIDSGITKLSGSVARQIQVAGGMFDTSGANIGSSGSAGFLGLFSSSTTRELWDLGMDLNGASVAQILQNGIDGRTYQIVQQIKKSSGFLGIGGGTKTTYQTSYGQIDPSITDAINGVIYSLRQGLVEASKVVGLEGAAAMLDNFRVEIGRLSFKGMTGEEIESQLNAVFSKVGDQMAGAILPSLAIMQKVGEGLFETFMRVAREYQVVDVSLKSIGLTFGATGVASLQARDALVQMFESLDEFVSQTDFYRQNFLTDAERMAPIIGSVADEMVRLGLSTVDTISEFKGVIDSLDLTTEAGRTTYAALMAVAPAFSSIIKYQDKLAKSYDDQASSLRSYLSDLLGKGSATSLATAAATFRGTAAESLLGDLDALGALKGVSNTFLDAAKQNAKSPLDYARARAEVLRTVGQAANVADDQAALQRKQLAVAEQQAASIAGMRTDLTELQQQMVASNNAIAAVLQAASDGDSLRVSNDDDNPLTASVSA